MVRNKHQVYYTRNHASNTPSTKLAANETLRETQARNRIKKLLVLLQFSSVKINTQTLGRNPPPPASLPWRGSTTVSLGLIISFPRSSFCPVHRLAARCCTSTFLPLLSHFHVPTPEPRLAREVIPMPIHRPALFVPTSKPRSAQQCVPTSKPRPTLYVPP